MELNSASLPQPFLRKLTKKAEEEARNATDLTLPTAGNDSTTAQAVKGEAAAVHKGHAVAALGVVMDVVAKNKLLPCWKEMRQAAALVTHR